MCQSLSLPECIGAHPVQKELKWLYVIAELNWIEIKEVKYS